MRYTVSLLDVPEGREPMAVLFDGQAGDAYTLDEFRELRAKANGKFPLDLEYIVALDDAIRMLDDERNNQTA